MYQIDENEFELDLGIKKNKRKVKECDFPEDKTIKSYSKNSFVYEFLYSLRQKINDPLGKKKIK